MNFTFKIMNSVLRNEDLLIKHDGFCINNDVFCIENDVISGWAHEELIELGWFGQTVTVETNGRIDPPRWTI